MTVDVSSEVHIRRARPEVAAFMFNPVNDVLWTSGLVDAHLRTGSALEKGAQIERVSRFLGRTFSYIIEVIDHVPHKSVEMYTTKPFEMRVFYELEDSDDGTLTRIRAQGGGSGFFNMAGPLLSAMVRRSIAKDLSILRACLEAKTQ